jgi:hypothetical protein
MSAEVPNRMMPTRHVADGDDYNYHHFNGGVIARDMKRVVSPEGAVPGNLAPGFELRDSEGRDWRLDGLRGRPVVLITGSGTCPMTHGSLFGLKEVYREFRSTTQWFYLYVREAHPGERIPAHESYEQKRDQAERFRRMDGVPWPVLVDDVDGAVAQQYTLLPNAQFVIDAEGFIAFRGNFAHGPSLYRALEQLDRQGNVGQVPAGTDSMPHLLHTMTYGWDGIRRGGTTATADLWKTAPPVAAKIWFGSHVMRPLLQPLAGRGTPLPAGARVMLGAAAVLGALAIRRSLRRRRRGAAG